MAGPRRAVLRGSPPELARALVERWRSAADDALRSRDVFAAALSGGRTPEVFYRELAATKGLPWSRTHLFLVDERVAPAGSPESNAAMIRASLRGLPAGAPAGFHQPPVGERPAGEAAEAYEREIRSFFVAPPVFDLVLLGLGADGHTASLFPGSPALGERSRLVVDVPEIPGRLGRVTLTLPAINAARRAIFLVTGAEKAPALRRVLAGDPDLPGSLVQPGGGEVEILADREALPAGD